VVEASGLSAVEPVFGIGLAVFVAAVAVTAGIAARRWRSTRRHAPQH
jgi:hypothetical protein